MVVWGRGQGWGCPGGGGWLIDFVLRGWGVEWVEEGGGGGRKKCWVVTI